MSIITKILNWFRGIQGTTNTAVIDAPYKVEVPDVVGAADTTWPFPTNSGFIAVEGMGVIKVANPKTAAITAKPKAPAKPKVVKAPLAPKAAVKSKAMTAKIKAPATPKPVAKPKTPAKPTAPSKKV